MDNINSKNCSNLCRPQQHPDRTLPEALGSGYFFTLYGMPWASMDAFWERLLLET